MHRPRRRSRPRSETEGGRRGDCLTIRLCFVECAIILIGAVPLATLRGPAPYEVFLRKGAVAQLGERLHGMQEVRGSTPLSSKLQLSLGERSPRRQVRGSGATLQAPVRQMCGGRPPDARGTL